MAAGSSVAQYLPEQVLQHEDRDVGPDLHLADQILADDLPCEDRGGFLIELRHGSPPYSEMAVSIFSMVASSTPVVASSRTRLTVFGGESSSSVTMTVTVFGSICLLLLSAIFSITSPVASSKPYEALTGEETGFPFDRSSTRTFGGSISNRPVLVPVICTEKKRVVSFFAPGKQLPTMPAWRSRHSVGLRRQRQHRDD